MCNYWPMPGRPLPVLVALALAALLGCDGGDRPPTLAAAASLRNVVPALVDAWGGQVAVTYGASGTLRRQVEGGAPIDAVLFAGAAPVDSLIEQGLADPATRRRVAHNTLVLIGPLGADPVTWRGLGALPPDEMLVIGDPGAVPAGQYAKEALVGLGSWASLTDRMVLGGDVAMVLAYARRGEVAAAAVYATDAVGLDDVQIFDRADWPGAPRPEVVVAATTDNAEARSLLDFMVGTEGQAVLLRFGFGAP